MKKTIKKYKSITIHILKSLLVPSTQGGPLANYQSIIAIGIWTLIICGTFSLVIHSFSNEPSSICSLLVQFSVGIFCSMLVMIITSYLQFKNTRDEMLGDFCNTVFLLTSMYKKTMDLTGVIRSNMVEFYSNKIVEEKDNYDKVAFKFFWFSKKKSDAHLEVVRNILSMVRKLNVILEKKKDDTDRTKNKEILDNIVENMIILSENYYPDQINLFKHWIEL